jgi:hypothetical protein
MSKTYENNLALSFISASGVVISSFQLLEVQPDGKKIAVAVVDYDGVRISRQEYSGEVNKKDFYAFLDWATKRQGELLESKQVKF